MSQWHQSKSDPRKVYDERHQQACLCETPEQAALIVEAINNLGPDRYRGKGIAENHQSIAGVPEQTDAPAHTFTEDACCGPRISRAIRNGTIGQSNWTCPKCGCEWACEDNWPVLHWAPKPMLEVIR
jgi:hypothetical protein